MISAITRAFLATALVTVMAACTGGSEVADLSSEEATAGVEQRIQATAAQLFPGAELEPDSLTDTPCGGLDPDGGTFAIEHVYWVRGVPAGRNVPLIEAARDWWLAEGYEHNRDNYDRTGRFYGVSVYDSDRFYLRLWRNPKDDLLITGASPCIRSEESSQ